MNKILINYLLLMSASIVSVMSQQNEYESFIEKGNNSFEENSFQEVNKSAVRDNILKNKALRNPKNKVK